MLRSVLANLFNAFTLFLIVSVLAFEWAKLKSSEEGPFNKEAIFIINAGESINNIANRLERDGLISSIVPFKFLVISDRGSQKVKFGEYLIPSGTSMEGLLKLFSKGESIQYSLTIPEGKTSWEIIQLVNRSLVLNGTIDKLPKEGVLAPDTYFTTRFYSRAALIDRMKRRQENILDDAWKNRQKGLPFKSKNDLLILASIIEKETSVALEKRVIASVMINRLRNGMRLQTDPSVIYGVTEGKRKFEGKLTKTHLKEENFYNTYRINGLPVGPICNPSMESIIAASDPATTPFFYYVADGAGGHAFSKTLKEHNKNVFIWRKTLDNR